MMCAGLFRYAPSGTDQHSLGLSGRDHTNLSVLLVACVTRRIVIDDGVRCGFDDGEEVVGRERRLQRSHKFYGIELKVQCHDLPKHIKARHSDFDCTPIL